MRLSAKSRRVLLVGVLGAALLAGVVGHARGGEAVVVGHASTANVKALFDKLTKLAEKFVPGAGGIVEGWNAMLLQAPEWVGVDWSKPANVVLFSGKAFGKTQPVPVVIVALADGALFRQALPAKDARIGFEVRGDVAIVSPEKAALAAITPERFKLYSGFPKVAGAADLYVTLYTTQAMAEYQAEVDGALKQLDGQFGEMFMVGPMAGFGKVLKCLGPLVGLAGTQVRRVSLSVELKDDALELWGRLSAGEDTELGTFLSGQPTEMTDLVKYLPADAVMGLGAKLDMAKGKPLVDAIVKALAGPLELSAADQQKIRDLVFNSTQTGEAAAALAGGQKHPGIQSIQVLRVADAAKYRAASKDGIEWLMKSGLGNFMEAAGVKVNVEHKPNAREYQGIAVDRLTVSAAPAPGAEPNPLMGQRPPQVTEYAAAATLAAAATGDPGGSLLNDILDRIKGAGTPGLNTAAAWKTASAAAPQGASLVAYISFNGILVKAVEEMDKQQPGVALLAGMFIKPDLTEEPITTHATFGNNMVEFRTRVPHQPILGLVTRVRKMVEMQGRPGRRPGPKPKEEDDF